MAMKNRKLFPALTSTNQTDCPDFCDTACPYNCYSYADYYFLPPPPPPPPPLSLLPKEHNISPYVIVIVALLAGFFLLVSYYVIVAKSCPSWWCFRNSRQPPAQSDNTDEELLDENRVDHPIWLITTIGLQQSIINSITVCKYKKGEGLIEGTECSVCLSEFQQDETLRLLPKCNHAFHIPCIDTWLRSHTNCPLCRAHIVNDAVTAPLVSVYQNPDNLNAVATRQLDTSGIDPELGNNIQERVNEVSDNRSRADEGNEILVVRDERIVKEDVNANDNGDSVDNYQVIKSNMKPMRRSSSMDSLTAATMCLGVTNHSPDEITGSSVDQIKIIGKTNSNIDVLERGGGGENLSYFRPITNSSITQCLHKRPVPMKRSFSCGGRFFSSRSLNSILPL